MKKEVSLKINVIRENLAANPEGIISGEIGMSNSNLKLMFPEKWSEFIDFLSVTDGGRFGSIDIWSSEYLMDKQFYATDLPGGRDKWLIIGQILYQPIAMDLDSRLIYIISIDNYCEMRVIGDFEWFILEVLLGKHYIDVVPDGEQDEWWGVLLACSYAN